MACHYSDIKHTAKLFLCWVFLNFKKINFQHDYFGYICHDANLCGILLTGTIPAQ